LHLCTRQRPPRKRLRSNGLTGSNPPGTKVGFTNGWMGIIGEISVPLPENFLVKWRSHAGYGLNLSTVCFL
jgi:hypothetical protein